MYGSPADGDDSSSVGSGSSRRRERSGSLNSGSGGGGSGYGSPQHGSPMGSYEMAGAVGGVGVVDAQSSEYGIPKRFSGGLQINTSVGGGQWGRADSTGVVEGMGGLMKQGLTPPIGVGVGGGGNGGGFAMMMM